MRKCVLSFLLLGTVAAALGAAHLTVAVAANAEFAAKAVVADFAKDHDITVEPVIGASGTFTAQIRNGAPFDVFLSADMAYPQALQQAGLVLDGPRIYAYGALALWTMTSIDLGPGLAVLATPGVRTIAIANPANAPYGVQALAALQRQGLLERVRAKIVYGESIAQVNSYVLSGAADVGMTATSVVLSPSLAGKGHWVAVDPAAYDPIAQGVVLLHPADADPARAGAARLFYDFLFSDRARAIFQAFGYRLPDKGKT